jgi:hypothetical protein
MRKLILIALVGLASAVGLATRPAAAAAADSAQAVAASCRDLLKPNPPKSFEVGLCFGSFTTLFALSGVVDQNQAPILGFCRPPKTGLDDLVRVFVRHVESHPQTAQGYYAIEAINALVDAYPCKPK